MQGMYPCAYASLPMHDTLRADIGAEGRRGCEVDLLDPRLPV
jgi:hypothetical protein